MENTNKNAQEIIDEAETSDFMQMFYPSIHAHELAEVNLSKCALNQR